MFSKDNCCDTTQLHKKDFYLTRRVFWEYTSYGQIFYKNKTLEKLQPVLEVSILKDISQ